jgi:hypothetical protein
MEFGYHFLTARYYASIQNRAVDFFILMTLTADGCVIAGQLLGNG